MRHEDMNGVPLRPGSSLPMPNGAFDIAQTTSSYLLPFAFETSALAPRDQFAAWRRSLAAILELSNLDRTSTGYDGKQVLWDLGPLVLAHFRSDPAAYASIGEVKRTHCVDHWMVSVVRNGVTFTASPRGMFESVPGCIQIHSLGQRFSGYASKSDILALFIPRDFSSEVACALEAREFSLIDETMGCLLADYLTVLSKQLRHLPLENVGDVVLATRAMILACITPSPTAMENAKAPISLMLLERARRILESNLFEPTFNVEKLRRELGVSRTVLYRLFEPFGGVAHYTLRRRLLGAHAALADPANKRLIFEIAEDCGFSGGTEFSRAFKREFGYRPTDVRMGLFNGVPARPMADLASSLPEDRLSVLMRQLRG